MFIAICSLWSTDHKSKVSQVDTPREGGGCIDENQRWSPAHIRQSYGTHKFISHQDLILMTKHMFLGSVECNGISLNSGLYSLHDKIWYL